MDNSSACLLHSGIILSAVLLTALLHQRFTIDDFKSIFCNGHVSTFLNQAYGIPKADWLVLSQNHVWNDRNHLCPQQLLSKFN